MLNLMRMVVVAVFCLCHQGLVVAQFSEQRIRDSIWNLDEAEFLPSKYACAVQGKKDLLYTDRGISSLDFSGVIYADSDKELRVDAHYSEKLDLESLEPKSSSWRVVFHSGSKQIFKVGDIQRFEFDLSKRLSKEQRSQINGLERVVYWFDPQILPIAPPSFTDRHQSATNMIFALYDSGKIVKHEEIGSKILTEWRVGARYAGKVSIEFESKLDGVILPVYAKWEVPNDTDGKEDVFTTTYVVKTEWMEIGSTPESASKWAPRRIVSSRRVGRGEISRIVDTVYNFFWSNDIPASLDEGWFDFNWERQLEAVKVSAISAQQ